MRLLLDPDLKSNALFFFTKKSYNQTRSWHLPKLNLEHFPRNYIAITYCVCRNWPCALYGTGSGRTRMEYHTIYEPLLIYLLYHIDLRAAENLVSTRRLVDRISEFLLSGTIYVLGDVRGAKFRKDSYGFRE